MRNSDIPCLADILAHLNNRDAIIQLLHLAEVLHNREELEIIKEAIEEEKDKAAKMQAVLTAERDEALSQVKELKKLLALADAGWVPYMGDLPKTDGPVWVKFNDGQVLRVDPDDRGFWPLCKSASKAAFYRTTPPPDETSKENDNGNA